MDTMEGIAEDGSDLTDGLAREARIRSAYLQWCKDNEKEPDEDRFPTFSSNFLAMEEYAAEAGKEMSLNAYADMTEEEYLAATAQPEPVAKAAPAPAPVAKVKTEAEKKAEEEAAAKKKAAEEAKAKKEAEGKHKWYRVKEYARVTKKDSLCEYLFARIVLHSQQERRRKCRLRRPERRPRKIVVHVRLHKPKPWRAFKRRMRQLRLLR